MTGERITVGPAITFGKPVIRGTRITVERILRKLATGVSTADIPRDHPNLSDQDTHAAQAYAADVLSDEEVLFG